MTRWATQSQTFHGDSKEWLGSDAWVEKGLPFELDLSLFDIAGTFTNGFLPSGIVVAKRTSDNMIGQYDPGTIVNEQQTVTITGTPTGGTFTLGFEGETTAAIAFNAAAAAVKAALEDLDSIVSVTVTGGPGPGTPWVVTFSGPNLSDTNVPQMTATSSLTGGTSPAVAVTTGTGGGGTGEATGGAGLDVAFGHLLAPISTTDLYGVASTTGIQTCAVFTRGRVREALLPTGHGLDAAAKRALTHIEYI